MHLQKSLLSLLAIVLLQTGAFSQSKKNKPVTDSKFEPAAYVNPFIGTGGHGHTFPGATVPFGMVQLSPDTRLEGWDGCGGYHYTDKYIYGFSHTHLSGTGVPDYCDVLVMPFTGDIHWNNGSDDKPGYRSRFNHENEAASPGYYKVNLLDDGIEAQLTATERAGFHSYKYNNGGNRQILVDLFHRDKVTNSWIKIVSENEIAGFRGSSYWADDQRVYFVMMFSENMSDIKIAVNDTIVDNLKALLSKSLNTFESKNLKVVFDFGSSDKPLMVKVGISGTSIENARANLVTEINHWDFDLTKQEAKDKWNKELRKIIVKDNDKKDLTVFYTAMYHTMISPNLYNDVNGSYLGRDLKEHKTEHNYYTVFSLWDTYRAYHPLMTIIDQKRTNDFIKTFIKQYEDGGLLPVWELSANETWCMIGYHAIPVIADAYLKGIRDYDANKAMKAMLASANNDIFGLKYYKKYGFIPADRDHESVSKTLEYSYDDWCIGAMANSMGMTSLADSFMIRAQGYRHLYDPQAGFMRARYNGAWFNPFEPREVNNNYTEANSWQYTFYVPHDMDNFIKLLNGQSGLRKKLDDLFTASQETTGREQSDITGLIGQYAHGNEPSHQIAYLYNYAGTPWKTQEKVDFIMHNFYTDQPDGLIGNEDCGQMSAWAVLSAMGFYPVCPGTNQYVIGTPLFDQVTINLENGKQFKVEAKNRTINNKYIQSVKLNGKHYNRSYLTHEDIMKGGVITFLMDSIPSETWGVGKNNEPYTAITNKPILPAPVIANSEQLFESSTDIKLIPFSESAIHYTLDGSDPNETSPLYSQPIHTDKSLIIKCRAYKEGFDPSTIIQSVFTKRPEGIQLQLNSRYASQYSGNGEFTLLDGLKGSEDFRLGGWQGFQGIDIDAEIKLDNGRTPDSLKIGFLQDINAWIFMPEKVQLWASTDRVNYNLIGTVYADIPQDKWGIIKHDFVFNLNGITDRFLKIKATNIGTCPQNHKGYPNPAWLFSDEIEIIFK